MRGRCYNTPARYNFMAREPWWVSAAKTACIPAFFLALAGLIIQGPVDLSIVQKRIDQISSYFESRNRLPAGYRSDNPESSKATRAKLQKVVTRASREFDVHEELIWAVIAVESNFDEKAKSRVGAMGLMQLMPDTANFLEVRDPFDPAQNIRGGTRYLSYLIKEFQGDWKKALAAYNSGPETVKKHNGIPPYPETKAYVSKVMTLYRAARGKSA